MMKALLLFLFSAVVFLAVTVSPSAVYAQQIDTNTPSDGTLDQQATYNTKSSQTKQAFDWRWLLPLLAIPVVFFAFRDTSNEDYYRDQYLQGLKGGHTHRESEFGDDDDEEE